MNLRVLLPLFASAVIVSCGTSTTKIADCTGVCAGGTFCDYVSGRCITNTTPTTTQAATGMPCDVAGVLAAKCISCHGTTPSGGAPNALVTRADLAATSPLGGTYAARCVARVQSAQMPPSYTGDSVSAADLAVLQNYVNTGMPGGACATAGSTATGGGNGDMGGGNGATGGGSGNTGGGSAGTGGGSAGTGGGTAGTGGGTAGTGGGTAGTGGGSAGTGGGSGTSSPYCRPCTADTDCGGTTNYCLGFSFGDFCGADCSASGTCAAGQRCANIIDNTTMAVIGRNCVPVTGSTCAGSGTGGGTGTGGGAGTGGGTGTGGGGGTTQCTTDTWANYGQSFFATNCASCHHHTGEFSTKSFVVTYKSSINSRISSGNMPPNGLTTAAKTRILKYLSCGVP